MELNKIGLTVVLIGALTMSACAAYRTKSNVELKPVAEGMQHANVIIAEDALPGRKYEEVGPIEVRIKKLTLFNKNPTKEQANEALIERARVMGADAVVNVVYKHGIGVTTWGYIDAKGMAVKFTE
jgi:uncharacterized protein YbjQ (UPF0145 family)